MTITTAIAIYFLFWWITLFAVLPFGVRSQEEQGAVVDGTDPGAPALPALGRKLLLTTLFSALAFAAFLGVYTSGWISLDDLTNLFGSVGQAPR